jgi:type IV pilus assembly protein PilQ
MSKLFIKKRGMLILFLVLLVWGLPEAYCLDKLEDRIFPPGSFSMELENADVRDILRALAKESKLNIIISEEVTGKVTMNFHNVSFDDAFLSILRGAGLGYVIEGKIVRVDLAKAIQEEKTKRLEAIKKQKEAEQKAKEAERKTREDAEKLIELKTVAVKVNYIINSKANQSIAKELGVKKEAVKDLDNLRQALSKLLSDRKGASIEIVESNNTLLITDIPRNVEKIVRLIEELDIPCQ